MAEPEAGSGMPLARDAGSETLWVPGIAVVLLVVASIVAMFWPTIETLREEWRDTETLTYTHGYLIAALSLWLLLRSLRRMQMAPRPDWRMLAPLLLLSVCWLVFYRAGIELLHQVLLPAIAIVAVYAAIGFANGRRLTFPLAYLYFAIPIWSVGNEILQTLTVVAVRLLLYVSNVPAFVTGNFVYIPSGAFEIAGGCSGLHFFIVAVAIAAIFGEIHQDSLRVRIKQILLAATLAVVTNWIRVYTIIVAGHLTDMRHYLITVDHYYFGWFLFVFTMAAFFWLASRMPTRPLVAASTGIGSRTSSWVSAAIIAVIVAGVGPALDALSPIRAASAAPMLLPELQTPWQGPHAASPEDWQPKYPGADWAQVADYRKEGRTASGFVAQYLQQRQGKELVGFDNSLPGSGAGVETREVINTGAGEAVLLQTEDKTGRSMIAYRFLIGDAHRVGDFSAQLTYAVASLRGPLVSQLVAARARCTGADCSVARTDATELLEQLDRQIATSHVGE